VDDPRVADHVSGWAISPRSPVTHRGGARVVVTPATNTSPSPSAGWPHSAPRISVAKGYPNAERAAADIDELMREQRAHVRRSAGRTRLKPPDMRVAALYDIHGNDARCAAVLAEIQALAAT